jgi:hypothetical protein
VTLPRIIVYQAVDEPHHEAYRFMALILHADDSPAIYRVTGRTAEIARDAAEKCWADDKARLRTREAKAAPITPVKRRRREEPDEHAGAPNGDVLGYLQTAPPSPIPALIDCEEF